MTKKNKHISKKKREERMENVNIFFVFLLLSTSLFGFGMVIEDNLNFLHPNKIKGMIETDMVVTEGNITYHNILENYYDVEYKNTREGLELKINNPCIEIVRATGLSMKPYWANNTLAIMDTCYPRDNLKIGDVIMYYGELDSTKNPHHRIIDIDYEKRWVRTQGDNVETNPRPDDFVGFDRIMGKDIGTLNLLEDQKIVKQEIVEFRNISWINDTTVFRELPQNITFNITFKDINITNTKRTQK